MEGKAHFIQNKKQPVVDFFSKEELSSPRDVLEEGLNERHFQDGKLFFLRAYFDPKNSDQWVLFLGAHHAIIDGGSANIFIFDFLEFLQCYLEGTPLAPQLRERRYPMSSPDSLIPLKFWKSGSRIKFFLKQTLSELGVGKILPKVIKKDERRTQVHIFQFDEEVTRDIVKSSKRENTTVQGAITAAFLYSMRTYFSKVEPKIKKVKYLTIMSMRPYTEGKGNGVFGCFASNAFAIKNLSGLSSFWDEARNSKKENDAFINSGFPFVQLQSIEKLLSIAAKLNKRDIATFTLSNVGLVKPPKHIWKFKLKNVYMGASINSFGAGISTGIQTVNGKLTISLYYLTKYFNRVSIAEFAKVLESEMLEGIQQKSYVSEEKSVVDLEGASHGVKT